MEKTSNKIIVADFYKKVVGQRDSSLINTFVREDYIQHSAMGKPGRQGLFEMVEFLKTLPPSTEIVSPVKMLLGDEDMVVILLDIFFMGKRMLVIDLFRLQEGILAEHWDAVQETTRQQDHIQIEDNPADTSTNKQLVNEFYQEILINGKIEFLGKYLSPDHITRTSNDPLDAYLNHQIKVHRIIGEGDLVVVQSELIRDGLSFALYDILRVKDRHIAEHWSVRQQIPEVMMYDNGIF